MSEDRPTMQAQPRIDPSAREGIKRLFADHDDAARAALIRDCLRAVDRLAAVNILNEHLLGTRLPATSDRGRMAALLRDVLRARRPDAYECLQSLTSYELESRLDDAKYDAYEDAVEKLNDAAKGGKASAIASAASGVIAAMRAGLDDEAIRRHVTLHALPETLNSLLDGLSGKKAGAGKTGAHRSTKASGEPDREPAGDRPTGRKSVKPSARKAAVKGAKTTAKPRKSGPSAGKQTTAKRGAGAGVPRRKSAGKSSRSGS